MLPVLNAHRIGLQCYGLRVNDGSLGSRMGRTDLPPTARVDAHSVPNAGNYLDDATFQPIDKGASPLRGSRTWHS